MARHVRYPVVTKVTDGKTLSYVTNAKKGNFVLSEVRLYEEIVCALNRGHFNYQIYMSTQPFIAIHILGKEDFIQENEKLIFETIKETVERYHQNTSTPVDC
jgi:hypothetical protein